MPISTPAYHVALVVPDLERATSELTAALGFASTFVILAVLLFCDRDTAPIFGHLSYYAGVPHR